VNILCFISLLILSLEVGAIKRLLWPLNGLEAPFKNGKKQQKWLKQQKMAFNFVFKSSYNLRAREKFIK